MRKSVEAVFEKLGYEFVVMETEEMLQCFVIYIDSLDYIYSVLSKTEVALIPHKTVSIEKLIENFAVLYVTALMAEN